MRDSQLSVGKTDDGAVRAAYSVLARGTPSKLTLLSALAASGALALAGSARADLPVLTHGHTDVGVNYEDGAWDLHVHAEDLGMEYEPDAVWLKVAANARTVVPSAPAFRFLGSPGAPIWVLPAVQRPDLLFLGLGTEELASGIFSNNTVRLALKSVEGPGDFMLYQLDAFGAPIASFNSRDGVGSNDFRTLTAGEHTHVNWAFTAPGQYRIGLQASGALAGTGERTTSEVAVYLFDVGELPRLTLARGAGRDPLHLKWFSETNALYQIQCRVDADSGGWANLGAALPGTGGWMEELIEPAQTRQFFRLRVDYNPASEPGLVARLSIADATDAVANNLTPSELDPPFGDVEMRSRAPRLAAVESRQP